MYTGGKDDLRNVRGSTGKLRFTSLNSVATPSTPKLTTQMVENKSRLSAWEMTLHRLHDSMSLVICELFDAEQLIADTGKCRAA